MAARSSIRDVAERAAVSVGTVSNFLNDTKPIAPATAERIRAAIDELGFIPNAAVRVMQGARSRLWRSSSPISPTRSSPK